MEQGPYTWREYATSERDIYTKTQMSPSFQILVTRPICHHFLRLSSKSALCQAGKIWLQCYCSEGKSGFLMLRRGLGLHPLFNLVPNSGIHMHTIWVLFMEVNLIE